MVARTIPKQCCFASLGKGKRMSWKPEVMVDAGKWSQNGLVFATEAEARDSANDLMMRWFAVKDCRAVESTDAVNYTYHNHELKAI
jgi:hypothetical protein